MTLTLTDLFCGAGGSSTGAVAAGVEVRIAANHWTLAVETHQTNHPEADHDCADISQVDFRRYPATDLLWCSPECTNHSTAKGKKRATGQGDMFAEDLGDDAAVRSRATMWDVLRAIEVGQLRGRPYLGGVVENVVDAVDWMYWDVWRAGFEKAGYQTEVVFLNSMFARDEPSGAVPAPQSRDRLYVVFWLASLGRRPDVNVTLPAWCPRCETTVAAEQVWKRADRMYGRYRAQYIYRCPTLSCRAAVEPTARAASEVIDWTLAAERIGDRAKPLAPATLARIRAGVMKHGHPVLAPAGGSWNESAMPVTEPFRTRTTRESEGLACPPMVVPTQARAEVNSARTVTAVMPTQTARAELAVVIPEEPYLVKLRGGGERGKAHSIHDPLGTVSAGGEHHGLVTPAGFVMRNNTARGNPAQLCTGFNEPIRTLTTSGHQSVVEIPAHLLMTYYGNGNTVPVSEPVPTCTTRDRHALVGVDVAVDDCTFRMLQPHEIAGAMAFPDGYVVLGNKREKVRQLGNAVTPPAAQILVDRLVRAITGDAA